jgi:hypothetical protein
MEDAITVIFGGYMKFLVWLVGCLLIAGTAVAQLTVISSDPAPNSVNVPLTKVITLTFSAPLDTNSPVNLKNSILSNIDTINGYWYSADKRSLNFDTRLMAGKVYFLCLVGMSDSAGESLNHSVGMYFTTAAAFAGHHVTGTIHPGSTGVSASHALVVLSARAINEGDPVFLNGAVCDGAGNFDMPYVSDGVYYPIAAKDANGDGTIDPSHGDVIGTIDSITVNGADINGLSISFISISPLTWTQAVHQVDSVRTLLLPPDASLLYVSAYGLDSLARTDDWTFYYHSASADTSFEIRTQTFATVAYYLDSMSSWWIKSLMPITDLASAAPPDSIIARAEQAGGAAFRQQAHPDSTRLQITLNLGQLGRANYWGVAPSVDSLYWGLDYEFGYEKPANQWNTVWAKKFVGNYYSGQILNSSGVNDPAVRPEKFALSQNWPNPFNPVTTIGYTVGSREFVTLRVYDLLGRETATLVNEVKPAGTYSVRWNAAGKPSGVYFYRLQAGTKASIRSMILVK